MKKNLCIKYKYSNPITFFYFFAKREIPIVTLVKFNTFKTA